MDPIANMLVSIKNGYMAKKLKVSIPYSKFKFEIAKVLEKENVLGKVEKKSSEIIMELLYSHQKPRISEIKRISKSGLRIYAKSKNIKRVRGGRGLTLISTSKGIMTDTQAKSKKLGGEVICQIW